MSDDKTVRATGDAQRINVNEDYEVRYWTQKFHCSEAELRAAVERAGVMAVDVEAAVRVNRNP